jgi:hypothetical protein
MSYDETDWVKAITKLIEMTSKRELTWDIFTKYEEDAWTVVDRAYASQSNMKHYVVKSSRYRHFTDEDSWFWAAKFEFEVYKMDEERRFLRIATAPELRITSNLFSVVESSFAFKENALKGLLD